MDAQADAKAVGGEAESSENLGAKRFVGDTLELLSVGVSGLIRFSKYQGKHKHGQNDLCSAGCFVPLWVVR